MNERRMEPRRESSIESRLGHIESEVYHVARDVAEVKEEIRTLLVTRIEFTPVKLMVYGMVGIILSAVVGALVAMVVRQ